MGNQLEILFGAAVVAILMVDVGITVHLIWSANRKLKAANDHISFQDNVIRHLEDQLSRTRRQLLDCNQKLKE